jgi:CRISPR-associated protein Cas2
VKHCYMVIYDISNPKRVKKVFKTMKNYGEHIQFSVFLCRLDKKRLEEMKRDLSKVIEPEEDQVISINIGPEHSLPRLDITHLGRAPLIEQRSAIVI